MDTPYHAAVQVLPTAPPSAQDPTGLIVLELRITVEQGTPAGMLTLPVDVPPVPAVLTRREREVMDLLIRRYTNREIAGRLVVAESTVKHYVKRILAKLHVTNRYAAIEAVERPLRVLLEDSHV